MTVQGIISGLMTPPFGVLRRETGTLAGPGVAAASLTRVRGVFSVDAFGMAWSVITVPAYWGRRVGLVDEYIDPIFQFAPRFTDVAGHDFYPEVLSVHHDGLYYLFPQLFPTAVDVWLSVGVVVQFYWLVAL